MDMANRLVEETTIGCLRISSYDTGKAKAKILKRRNWQAMAAKIRDRLQAHPAQSSSDKQREWWFSSLAELKQYISQDDPLLSGVNSIRTRIVKRNRASESDTNAPTIQTPLDVQLACTDSSKRLLAKVQAMEALVDEFLEKELPIESWDQAFRLLELSQASQRLGIESMTRALNLERASVLGAIAIEPREDEFE